MLLSSNSPVKSVTKNLQNVNRLSFANQTTEEKLALEKRKEQFIKQREEKRRQETTNQSVLPENVSNSPEVSVLRKKTLPTDKPSNMHKSVSNKALMSSRREKAMAIHKKQLNTVDHTLNRPIKKSVATAKSQPRINSANIRKVSQLKGKNHDNVKQITQAIERTCLPGPINKPERTTVLEPIKNLPKTESHHLVLLFRNERFQFRGIYP